MRDASNICSHDVNSDSARWPSADIADEVEADGRLI
jgi:hypothetical protein